uniref:C-type lectin 4 n=1 Tax=Sinonovacula constricta TaxID=98310 RepID=A0A4Y1NWF6_SINCO|nr:C-type lectin 4 [Sinonovacula constricta]
MEAFKVAHLLCWICFLGPVVSFLLGNEHLRCPSSVRSHIQYVRIFEDKCYEFVIYTKHYWEDARIDCMTKGGDLVTIPNEHVQGFIMASLAALGNKEHGIWIGLSDKEHELQWRWVNGDNLHGYANWARAQGGANIMHLTQDCAQIRTDDHGLWHDKECHLWPQTASYICEYDAQPIPTTTTTKRTTTTPKPTTTPTTTTTTTITTTTTTTEKPTSTTFKSTTSPTETSLLSTTKQSTLSTILTKLAQSSTEAAAPTTVATIKTTEFSCRDENCADECPNGYAGIFVDLNGCVECNCN